VGEKTFLRVEFSFNQISKRVVISVVLASLMKS
jgi:hypothetical protein